MPTPQSFGHRRFWVVASIALHAILLTACDNGSGAENGQIKHQEDMTTAVQKESPMTPPTAPELADTPPTPSSMLYLIYQKDGDGALSYEIDDGAVATWWYGYAFELAGRRWYTGFAYNTPEVYGPEDQQESIPAPGAKVNITAATLYKDVAAPQKDWTVDGAYQTIGEFGAYERAGEVDATRKTESQATADGRMVLAVPTRFFANGIDSYGYEVFLFDPADLNLDANYGRERWAYVGNLQAGENNEADCGKEAGDRPCRQSQGRLSFGPFDASGLPSLRIAMTAAGSAEAKDAEYRYDPDRKQYVVQP